MCTHSEKLIDKAAEIQATIKFQMKKVLYLSVAIGHIEMKPDEHLTSHELPCISAEETLADCMFTSHKEYYGSRVPHCLYQLDFTLNSMLPVEYYRDQYWGQHCS